MMGAGFWVHNTLLAQALTILSYQLRVVSSTPTMGVDGVHSRLERETKIDRLFRFSHVHRVQRHIARHYLHGTM